MRFFFLGDFVFLFWMFQGFSEVTFYCSSVNSYYSAVLLRTPILFIRSSSGIFSIPFKRIEKLLRFFLVLDWLEKLKGGFFICIYTYASNVNLFQEVMQDFTRS